MEVAGNRGVTPPPLPPHPHHQARGMLKGVQRGRQPFIPPARQGEPPPREGRGTRGGAPLGPYATGPHTATRPPPQ